MKKRMIAIFILLIIFIISYVGFKWINNYIYNYADITITDSTFYEQILTTTFYDNEGNEIGSVGEQNVEYTEIEDISAYFIEALISIEDDTFYNHEGVSYINLITASIRTILTDTTYGGSTIDMQLAKLIYMEDFFVENVNGETKYELEPINYKLTQMSIALQINAHYSKTEILENYCNTLYFGSGGYGIYNASEYYFSTTPDKLTLEQAATLAGMINSPSYYDPTVNPDAAQERRDDVLWKMYTDGKITETEYISAVSVTMEESLNINEDVQESQYLDFMNLVYEELYLIFGDDFNIMSAGANVYTTLDADWQKQTNDALNNSDDESEYNGESLEESGIQAGTVTIDNDTGEILAVGNGVNYDSVMGTNYAYNYYRQPGSTAKPIVDYAPAMDALGWDENTTVYDGPITYSNSDINVYNANNQYYGPVTIETALGESLNCAALYTFQVVAEEIGLENMEEYLSNFGITDSEDINESYAIGGWSTGTTPLEMASAYSTFSNKGNRVTPHTISHVTFDENSAYYIQYPDGYTFDIEDNTVEVISEEAAQNMLDALDATNPSAMSNVALPEGYENFAIKTGTTDWGDNNNYGYDKNDVRDKWVVGTTTETSTAVWTGYTYEMEEQGYVMEFDDNYVYDIFKDIYEK